MKTAFFIYRYSPLLTTSRLDDWNGLNCVKPVTSGEKQPRDGRTK